MKKELFTKRLKLVSVSAQDCDIIHSMLLNSHVKKYLCDNREIEKEIIEDMVRKSDSLFEEKRIGLWLIEDRGTQAITGFCGFIDGEVLELIYVIHPDFQDNGFATECSFGIIDYFKTLNLNDRIFAKIDLENTKSHLVAKKIGMIEVGIEKNQVTGGDMKLYELEAGFVASSFSVSERNA